MAPAKQDREEGEQRPGSRGPGSTPFPAFPVCAKALPSVDRMLHDTCDNLTNNQIGELILLAPLKAGKEPVQGSPSGQRVGDIISVNRGRIEEEGVVVPPRQSPAQVLHAVEIAEVGAAPLGHDLGDGQQVRVVVSEARDQDVLASLPQDLVLALAADQQVATLAAGELVVVV